METQGLILTLLNWLPTLLLLVIFWFVIAKKLPQRNKALTDLMEKQVAVLERIATAIERKQG